LAKEIAMTDRERPSAGEAPELHNAEQDDESEQAQTVAEEALDGGARDESPLDSVKADEPGEVMDDASQDLVDRMRDMEQSGRIDMSAYRGEPDMDDDEDKYGEANKIDDLRPDGSDDPAYRSPDEES
jgi:hypothetical protein